MDIPASLVRALDAEEDVAVILDRDGVVRFVNAAWRRHAVASGAPGLTPEVVLGRRYIDFVQGPLLDVITRCIASALAGTSETGVHLHSECNTPTELRELTTYFATLRDGDGAGDGVVIRQALRVVGALKDLREGRETSPEVYRDARGLIVQCGCCRRVREPDVERWTTCIALLETLVQNVSHGLCATCSVIYYSEYLG